MPILLLAKHQEASGYRSWWQVVLRVGYRDNEDGYGKADEALGVLRGRRAEWAAKLLTTDARYNA